MNTHPLELLISQYLAEKDITRGSWELYNTILKQYTSYLKDHQILYAKKSDVINYREWKRNQGYSVRWIYHQISAIKGLYQYLSMNQKRLGLPEEYADDITVTIKPTVPKAILTTHQAKHLILHLKNNRKYIWHYRDYPMIYLMLVTGIRSIEIRRAKIKDLRMIGGKQILYVQGKGRTSADEFVKISDGLHQAIIDYLNKRKDKNPYLFISHSRRSNVPYLSRTFFLRMLRRVLKESGLEYTHITPHSLRHTAATMNLLRGGSLAATKQLMRHSNLSTTLLYAHNLEMIHDDSEKQIEDYILGKDKYQ
jgi:integrase/recombinase XerD